MKLITGWLLAFFVLSNGFSQNCSYKKNEIDKFTGKHVKITNPLKVIGTFYTEGLFSIKKEDSSYSFIFEYTLAKYSSFPPYSINRGSQLLFLLESGNQIVLESDDNIVGINNVIQGTLPVYMCQLTNVSYSLSRKQLEQFLTEKIKTIRFYRVEPNGKEDYVDNEIKRKDQVDISRLVKCIL